MPVHTDLYSSGKCLEYLIIRIFSPAVRNEVLFLDGAAMFQCALSDRLREVTVCQIIEG